MIIAKCLSILKMPAMSPSVRVEPRHKNAKMHVAMSFPKIQVVAVVRNFTERSGKRQDLYSLKIPQP